MNKVSWMMIGCAILFFTIGNTSIIIELSEEKIEVETECNDRDGDIILNQVCTTEVLADEGLRAFVNIVVTVVLPMGVLLMFIILFGSMVLSWGDFNG